MVYRKNVVHAGVGTAMYFMGSVLRKRQRINRYRRPPSEIETNSCRHYFTLVALHRIARGQVLVASKEVFPCTIPVPVESNEN